MCKLHLYVIFICSFFWTIPAWSQYFPSQELRIPPVDKQIDTLPSYQPFTIDLDSLYLYISNQEENDPVSLQFTIEGKLWNLEVWRSRLLHPDYELITPGKTNQAPISTEQTLFLKGRIIDQDEVNVALSVNNHFLFGQIGDLLIEPAAPYYDKKLVPNALISYYTWENGDLPTVFCGSKEEAKNKIETLLEESADNAKTQRVDQCYTVDLALAADYLAFQQFGDVYSLQNYYLGILNMVRLTYDDEFSDSFRFAVRGFYVVDCPGCDPWTASTEARDLLASFRDWGNAGGFGFNYDLASMWSGRILNDSLAGLGYLSVICETRRYHVLRNYTEKIGLLRTLQAHELGHNFSARHDPEDSPYIMAPAIADIDVWSEASLTKVESYVRLLVAQKEWCLGGCIPPEAAFEIPLVVGCAPLLAQFVDNSSGEVTAWQWSFEGGLSNYENFPNPLVWYLQPGVFGAQLRVSNAIGESTYMEDTVAIIKGLPLAGFTIEIDTIQRTAQFQFTGSEATTYSWQFGDGAESQELNPTHIYTENKEYQIQLIVTNECGADTSSQNISFPTPLQASFLPVQTTGCAPLSVQFSDNSIGEVTTRQWSFPGGFPEESTLAEPLVRYNQPGEYNVSLLISNANFESEYVEENAITVKGAPEVVFTFDINPSQRSVQFQFTGNDATSYAWQFGDGSESQEINPTHVYANSGEFEVKLTATNDCGANIYRQTIDILASPEAIFSADILQQCAPFFTTFTDHSRGEITTRRWSFPGGHPNTSSQQAPTVQYAQPGRYSVRLITGNAAGTDTLIREAYIHVLPKPEARFNVSGELGDTVFIFINDSFDATSYKWLFGDGQESVELLPSHYYENDGTYLAQLIAINECGSDTAVQTLQVLRPPTAAFEIASQSGCSSKTILFEDRSTGNVNERNWVFEGGIPATSDLANPIVTFSQPGYYGVTLTVKNAVGEQVLEKADLIYVPESPTARFSHNYLVGDSTIQFLNLSERSSTYLWDFGDGMQSTEVNPVHTYQQDGDYTIKLEARNECKTSLMITQVTVVTSPRAAFRADQINGCAPFEVQFESTSSENTQSLVWEFPGGRPATSHAPNPRISYTHPGLYDVHLTASNSAGEIIEEKKEWIQVGGPPQTDFMFEQNGPIVQFNNLSTDANAYLWNFGDEQTSQENTPTHEYQTEGTYEVQLIGINNCGADTTTQILSVIINGTKTLTWRETAKLFPNPNTGQFTLQLESLPSPHTQLRLWNSLGQLIQATYWNSILSYTQWIEIPEAMPGLYLLELNTGGEKGYWRVLVTEKD